MVEMRKEIERPAEAVKPREMPAISREQREFHTPLDTLGRSAMHMRTPNESARQGGPRAVSRADLDMRVARNVSALRLEGSTPVHERLLRMLESI
ncbi:MAG: hypothetical protein AB1324_07505 [Candidatus Micrarchaeota archaeon]